MNISIILPIAIILLLGISGVLIFFLLNKKKHGEKLDPLTERLKEFVQRGETVTLSEIELSQSLMDRVVRPILRRFLELVAHFAPRALLEIDEKKLEAAGNPGKLTATGFVTLRLALALILGSCGWVLLQIWPPAFTGYIWIAAILLALLGFYMPHFWLVGKIAQRSATIRADMPDAFDLLTLCVEAGLGFDTAMEKVSEKWDHELARTFGRAVQEIQLGKLRREALRDMAERINIPEMTMFSAAVNQSEQLGVSMAKILRIQADQIRVQRRQDLERNVNGLTTIKLVLLIIFFLPITFLWLTAPLLAVLLPQLSR